MIQSQRSFNYEKHNVLNLEQKNVMQIDIKILHPLEYNYKTNQQYSFTSWMKLFLLT
jgi:hypothetical protein